MFNTGVELPTRRNSPNIDERAQPNGLMSMTFELQDMRRERRLTDPSELQLKHLRNQHYIAVVHVCEVMLLESWSK